MINALNSIITGWSNYYQSVVSSEIFNKLDYRIWEMLWHWAKRRHTDKSNFWITGRYWHTEGNRNWVFSTKDKQLKLLSDKKIVRHTPVKLDKNPYLDMEYLVSRKMKQRFKKLTNKTFKILNNVKKICKPDTLTMTAARLRGDKMLEPYEAKVSRTVLRRGGTSNRSSLFSNT